MGRIDLCSRLRVYVVIDPRYCLADPLSVCRAVLAGGATAIQLRIKNATDRETLEVAREMRSLTTCHNSLLIINDRVDLAVASGADGVHLGVDDLPLAAARSIVGLGYVLGYSPENDAQTVAAAADGVNYLGVGPVYGTVSKDDAGPAIGLATLRRRRELSGLPVVGIGGIHAGNASEVIEAGACGVAVMSAIVGSPAPEEATRKIVDTLKAGQQANK